MIKIMEERIRLSEHFTYRKLFKFVMPSIIMMVFVSVYGIVDGFFVSENVEVKYADVVDTQFAYSDHNPVEMTFVLKGEA